MRDDTDYIPERERKILEGLREMREIIDSKGTYPSQVANEILKIDENCGDILFLKYLLYYSKKFSFIEKMLEDKEILININNIFYNLKLTFYLDNSLKSTKKKVVHFFLHQLKENFKNKYNYDTILKINEKGTDNRVVFCELNNIFIFIENAIKTFEEKVKVNLVKEYKQELIELKNFVLLFFSDHKYSDCYEFRMWNEKEQEEFERALNIRLTYFCANIGLPEKINISLNYEGSRGKKHKGVLGYLKENVFSSPFYAIISFPFVLADIATISYDSVKYYLNTRKSNKHLMEEVLSGNEIFFLEKASNTPLLVVPVVKKTDNPILLQDLENIESAKQDLSKLFSSQEKFDIYIQINCSMYLDPYLTYMETHPDLTAEEIDSFHNLFCKIKLILNKKAEELRNKDDEISKMELDVIKNQVDRVLKERNIEYLEEIPESVKITVKEAN